MKINDVINEAPIGDYQTIGDFSKNSSMRHPQDRKLIQSPKSIEKIKRKFDNTPYNFNLYFVNTPKGGKHTEVGEVDPGWVHEQLGEEVYETIQNDDDAIVIIFTNNSGAERIPMTPWIMAHRIGHTIVRKDHLNQWGKNHPMAYAFRDLIQHTSEILSQAYGYQDVELPTNEMTLSSAARGIQLLYKNFWEAIGTFKSARDKNLRDWFEMNNELFAQYVTTGNIRFNELPEQFKNGKSIVRNRAYSDIDMADARDRIEMLGEMMVQNYERVLSYATGKIYVM